MTPSLIRASVVTERVAWVRQMVAQVRALPLESLEIFMEDSRNAGAAESYLRRGIEALLDLGRHILAKGFAIAVSEYKEIGSKLKEHQLFPELKPMVGKVLGLDQVIEGIVNRLGNLEMAYLLDDYAEMI